jgi:hypothetical protein
MKPSYAVKAGAKFQRGEDEKTNPFLTAKSRKGKPKISIFPKRTSQPTLFSVGMTATKVLSTSQGDMLVDVTKKFKEEV